jgi:hypothetical protein
MLSMTAACTLPGKCGCAAMTLLAEQKRAFVRTCHVGLWLMGVMWLCVRRYIPHVGVVTILMNLYPWLKYVLLGVLGIFVLVNRE